MVPRVMLQEEPPSGVPIWQSWFVPMPTSPLLQMAELRGARRKTRLGRRMTGEYIFGKVVKVGLDESCHTFGRDGRTRVCRLNLLGIELCV